MIFCYALLLLQGKNNILDKRKCEFPFIYNFPISFNQFRENFAGLQPYNKKSYQFNFGCYRTLTHISELQQSVYGPRRCISFPLPVLLPSHFLAYWHFSFDLTQVNSLSKFSDFLLLGPNQSEFSYKSKS